MFVVYAMLGYAAAIVVIAYAILRGVNRREQDPDHASYYAPLGATPAESPMLHRVSIRNRKLRFYRSPLDGPDFPWAVLRDLFEIATNGATYAISAEWIYAHNPGLAQVIMTQHGTELLLSHWEGIALLTSLVPDKDERTILIAEFREAMAEAYVLQCAGMSRESFLEQCAAAFRRPHSQHA